MNEQARLLTVMLSGDAPVRREPSRSQEAPTSAPMILALNAIRERLTRATAFPEAAGFLPLSPGATIPTRVLWGDQHVHTGWSVDAGAFGATLGPEEALRFARGEEVMSSLGQPAKLSRPLDWAAVTDHSDAAGVIFRGPRRQSEPDDRSAVRSGMT